MSAAELRQAAALMRSRAEDCEPDGTDGYADWHETYWGDGPGETDGRHIAAWSPAVALAVADLLDTMADRNSSGSDLDWPHPRDLDAATAVARAYLGGADD